MIKLFYSNRIEQLYGDLKKTFFKDSPPFARRLLIVPTLAIKSWILLQLAQDPEIGIATGLEILYLEEALKKLSLLFHTDPVHYPQPLELAIAIEAHIRHIALSWGTLSDEEKNRWQPLFDYLKISPSFSTLSRKSEKRLATLSETLAKLFRDYGKYGQGMVEKWKGTEGWQQALWHHLFSMENSSWSFYSKEYGFLVNPDLHLHIHLFSISFLPKSEYQLFEKLAEKFPVHIYSISPCALFWSDILSDKETKKLQRFWKKQQAPQEQQELLENYLRDKNPLLANWGKLGRKTTELFEQHDPETYERYCLSSSFYKIPSYAEYVHDQLINEESSHSPSLLEHIQTDLLLMRKPLESEKISLQEDRSIQIHCTPNKQREVQIVYHTLLDIIKKEGQIEPKDIIVMAPDITSYAPYIQQFFGSQESLLEFQLMDMHAVSEDSLIKQFWHLIELPFGRWKTEDFLYLLNFPTFQKKHQITSEEVSQIRNWLKEADIRWGMDISHRNEILRNRHCQNMIENHIGGTWEGGFSNLLLGLCMHELPEFDIPLHNLESSQGILLGKVIHLLQNLQKDLQPLVNGTEKSYVEWMHTLQSLIETYLIDREFHEDREEPLFHFFEEFKQSARWVPDHQISFTALKIHLQSYLDDHNFIYHENYLQAVKFCSMLPMRAIPAKVIVLMGLDENSFPRHDNPISLNLMKENTSCDYYPSRTDYDRYLFLEALLSARKYFILTYTNYSLSDGKEQNPSLLITELTNYIKQAYNIHHDITYVHPYNAFDAQYFSQDTRFSNYSQQDYHLALSYYKTDKKPPHQFLNDFEVQKTSTIHQQSIVLDIRQIKTALQNPIKSYFNHSLGMFISNEEESNSDDIFTLDRLQIYDLKKSSLKKNWKDIVSQAEIQGKLPQGLFKKTALSSLQEEVGKYHEILNDLGIEQKNIFEITLNEHYQEPIQDDSGWKLPPLTIHDANGLEVKIVGTLSDISPQGLLANIKGDKTDLLKPWAEFILLCLLIDKHALPIEKQILCTKSGKIKKAYFNNAEEVLLQILDYYFESLYQVSPLIQEWLYEIVHEEADSLEKTMHKSLNDEFSPLYNEYVKWVCRSDTLNASEVIQHWQSKARDLFSTPYQEWL